MPSHQQDWLDVLASLPSAGLGHSATEDPRRAKGRRDAPVLVRLRARLFAARYDRQIENGVNPAPGSPLALHRARLSSPRERDHLANALQLAVHDAYCPSHFNARVSIRSDAVQGCMELIDAVCDRLTEPFPVGVRGMARLRILLADGRGPLYWPGRGTLNAALRGVLATL